jgi:hypothetical protein
MSQTNTEFEFYGPCQGEHESKPMDITGTSAGLKAIGELKPRREVSYVSGVVIERVLELRRV